MTTGEKIRMLCEKTHTTQKDLADSIGYTQAAMCRWIADDRNVKVDALVKIAKHFDVSVDYLLGLSNTKTLTIDELKAEAKAHGYHLIKDKPYIRFKPCTCGCNIRQHWSKWTGTETLVMLRCTQCGREACGRTEEEAKLNWNAMVDCAWK